MWCRLGIQKFISKTVVNDDSCDIHLSDLRRIWHKSLTNDEMLSISQKLNPLFEVSVQKLKEIALNLFEDETAQKEIKEENESLTLKLESNRMGIKFHFQVTLKEGGGDMLFNEFIIPLIATLARSENKVQKLIQTIKDKDAEILEYHQEWPGLKSSYLTTKPFNEAEFEKHESTDFQLEDLVFNPDALLDCIHKKLLCLEKLQTKEMKPLSQNVETNLIKADNEIIKGSLFSGGHSSNFNPSIKPNHGIIKKRKKQGFNF